MTERTREV